MILEGILRTTCPSPLDDSATCICEDQNTRCTPVKSTRYAEIRQYFLRCLGAICTTI